MTIRKLRAGRIATANAATWIGDAGTIFYDEVTGTLKISDGETPGGRRIILNAEDINVIKSCESELVSEIGLTLDQARKVSLWCQMECQRDWAQNIYLPQDQRPLHSPYSTYSHRGYRT